MNSFGEYIRNKREQLKLPQRKVAAQLDIDTSILSKIERDERNATKEMLPFLARILQIKEKELQVVFIRFMIEKEFGDLKYLSEGLQKALKEI